MSDIKNIELVGRDLFKVTINPKMLPFKNAEAIKKMKALGYDGYWKLQYGGNMFTTHDSRLAELAINEELAYLELRPEVAPAEGDKKERDSYEVISYYSKKQDSDAHKEDASRAKSVFLTSLYDFKNFQANPDLFSKLASIEAIAETSA